jgi:hypothetical protein
MHPDALAEIFQRQASTSLSLDRTHSPSFGASSHVGLNTAAHAAITPSAHQHPAHTSRHVHKTTLYSPYKSDLALKNGESAMSRKRSLSRQPSAQASPKPPHIHHDMPVTLPRIRETESDQTIDLTLPSFFPTLQALDMDGCTCGEGCACPGCTTHPENSGNIAKAAHGHAHMEGVQTCPSSCNSCFDCRGHVNVEPGIQSIQQLIDIAAQAIPPPASLRTPYSVPNSGVRSPLSGFDFDPLHTGVLPPNVMWNDDAANAMGLVKLKPLECCEG